MNLEGIWTSKPQHQVTRAEGAGMRQDGSPYYGLAMVTNLWKWAGSRRCMGTTTNGSGCSRFPLTAPQVYLSVPHPVPELDTDLASLTWPHGLAQLSRTISGLH